MINIIIIGAGGFGLEVVDLMVQINKKSQTYNIIGFLDDNKGGFILDKYSILGDTGKIEDFKENSFVVAIADPVIRKKYHKILKSYNIETPNLIHPSANVSEFSNISFKSGIIVNSFSHISASAHLLEGVIVDSLCYIGHETKIKPFSTLYSGVLVAGNTVIESSTQIGLGSKVLQNISIGSNTIIGASSTVTKNISNNVVAVGTPCKVIKER